MLMAPHDENDFIDREFEKSQQLSLSPTTTSQPDQASASESLKRIPAREQLEAKVGSTQQRLMALKQEQERLEKERVALEDLRRRRSEFSKGREEMVQNLTKGITLLEEEEADARRMIEALNQSLEEFRDHLDKVQALSEESWKEDDLNRELTRALITIDNARKEWISAVPKFPVLDSKSETPKKTAPAQEPKSADASAAKSITHPFSGEVSFDSMTWKQWAQFGLAVTWPVAAVLLVGVIMLMAIWLQGGANP